MAKTHWHYPRTSFAASVLKVLTEGPLQGASLFGPRRTGKTEFLAQDLGPMAHAAGHRVVYANFWQAVESPIGVLLYELDYALRHGSFLDRMQLAAVELAPKFKIQNPLGEGEVEIDLAGLKREPPDNLLLLIDQYLHRLADDKKPTLLLFDEFQELARGAGSKPLVAALRTSLDKRKNGLASVFTGSSQERLRAMFSPTQAPFFRFATQLDLPAFDADFVEHQIGAFRHTFKSEIKAAEAHDVFVRNDRNPLFLQRWLMTRGLHPELTAERALDKVNADLATEFGFAQHWVGLTPLQRAVALAMARPDAGLFSEGTATKIGALLGETPPATQRVQAAVKRLVRLSLADKWDREWRLADPLFEAWVRARPETDF